jgi:tRNA A37 threonylcarbamoyladenosine biosynthesis protein TsaE
MEGRERAFLADGGAEWLDGAGLAAVEWAARVASALPKERLDVELAHAGPTERRVTVRARGQGERADQIARMLARLPAIPALDVVT